MRVLRLFVLCLALLPGTAAAATLGEAKIGFSADRTLVIDDRTYAGKIWTMPGRERHEQTIHGLRPAFLLRAGSRIAEILLPQLKTVVQFEIPPELRLLDIVELKKHPIGRDTVNGVATVTYAIDQTIEQGHAKGTLWLSRDGIPIKLAGTFTSSKGKVSTVLWELTRIKLGPQPAALFEAPEGYSKLPPEALAPLLGLKLKSTEGR